MNVLVVGVVVLFLGVAVCERQKEFTAAVYEHAVILPQGSKDGVVSRRDALKTIMTNIDIYSAQAKMAALKRVDILVFPEGGLFGWDFDRNTITPYLEHVPVTKQGEWNPCTHPGTYPDSKIQHHLSCMARNNSLYIVGNLGNKIECDENADGYCPDGGQYQYNTAVVFDRNGDLVASYNKRNLNNEPQYDYPQKAELVSFNTPFGLFGLYFCDEIYHYDPAMRMIDELGIPNVVCPTSWRDSYPNGIAIQTLSGFARGFGINMLAANVHRPDMGKQGSGIYSPDGVVASYYDNRSGSSGKLLVATTGVIRRPVRQRLPQYETSMQAEGGSQDTFMSDVNGDSYKLVILDSRQRSLRLCVAEMCCEIEYDIEFRSGDVYAFGVFSGNHAQPKNGKYNYYQSCMVLKCPNSTQESCGKQSTDASSVFTHLRINAFFSTNYIYPLHVASRRGQLILLSEWNYQDGVLWSRQRTYPLVSAGFYGRIYERDSSNSQTICASVALLISCVYYALNSCSFYN
ncbi:vascular non-inflammatory molecule 3 isoform X2 [Patella vulgata]|nr:vascular non-inflammatory molecule 3 isoform X2 [Patella vulgata]